MSRVGPDSRILFLDKCSGYSLSFFSPLQDVGIHSRIPQTVAMGLMIQHLLPFTSCLTITSSRLMDSLDLQQMYTIRFALDLYTIRYALDVHYSCIHQMYTIITTYQLSDLSFQPQFIYHFIFFSLLDHRYGRSSFIIALYCRLGSGMFCRNLYFFVPLQSRGVELKEACGNTYLQQRMFEININTIQGEFLSCPPILSFFIWFN